MYCVYYVNLYKIFTVSRKGYRIQPKHIFDTVTHNAMKFQTNNQEHYYFNFK